MDDSELIDLVQQTLARRGKLPIDLAREAETSPQNVSNWLNKTGRLSAMAKGRLKAWLGDDYKEAVRPTRKGKVDRLLAIDRLMQDETMCDSCKVAAAKILRELAEE